MGPGPLSLALRCPLGASQVQDVQGAGEGVPIAWWGTYTYRGPYSLHRVVHGA